MGQKLPTLAQALAQSGPRQGAPQAGKLPTLKEAMSGHGNSVVAAPSKHHGTLLGNLVHEVESTVTGIVPGTIASIEHPVRAGRAIGQSYAQMYGPLVHGDVGKFYANWHARPLGPLLDAATVVTLGAGLGARAGVLSAETADLMAPGIARTLGQREGQALSADAGDVILRKSSSNPAIRARQVAVNKALNRLNARTPIVGSNARMARTLMRLHMRDSAALLLKGQKFEHAFAVLDKHEKAAWHLHARAVDPEGWSQLLEDGAIKDPGGTEAAMQKELASPKLNEAYHNVSKRLQHALDTGRDLSELMTKEKITRGYIEELSAMERPSLAYRLMSGTHWKEPTPALLGKPSQALLRQRSYVERLANLHDRALERVKAAGEKAMQSDEVMIGSKVVGGGPKFDQAFRDAAPQEPVVSGKGSMEHYKPTAAPTTMQMVGREPTKAEAEARLAELEKVHNKALDKMAASAEGAIDKHESRATSERRREYKKQQSGKDKNGRNSSAAGTRKAQFTKTMTDQRRDRMDKLAYDYVTKHPDEHVSKLWLARTNEMDALREVLNPEFGEKADLSRLQQIIEEKAVAGPRPRYEGRGPGRVLTPKGGARAERLGAHLSMSRDKLEQMEAAFERRQGPSGLLGGLTAEEASQEIAAHGRMQPFYVPDSADTAALKKQSWQPETTPPIELKSAKRNRGTLFERGAINLQGNPLSAEFNKFTRHVGRTDLHGALMEIAAKEPLSGLPLGYRYLKTTVGQKSAPYIRRQAATLKEAIATGREDRQSLLDHFTTTDPKFEGIATDGEGHRLIVPNQEAELLAVEAAPTSGIVQKLLYNKPTTIWKHMVLGLRPAYMTNIILSQAILGFLQQAPHLHGLTAFLDHAVPGVRLGKLTDATVEDVWPEQAHASFSSSAGYTSNRGLSTASKAYQGIMPATLQAENWLRRLMLQGWAMASPEVRAAMRENGGNLDLALREVKKTHPHVLDEISQRVDHAQGNYRTYSAAEQKLRQVVPFYGWDRHIVQSTYRLLAERPSLVNLGVHVGEYGSAVQEQQLGLLPTYLQSVVRLGGLPGIMGKLQQGRTPVVSTKAIGPFAADADILRTLEGFVHGKAGASSEEANNINPFLTALVEQLTGHNIVTGSAVKDKLPFGFGNVPIRAALGTPQARLIEQALGWHPLGQSKAPLNSTDFRSQLAAFLGVPIKQLNVPEANTIAKKQGEWASR